jgi:hypothetical protein
MDMIVYYINSVLQVFQNSVWLVDHFTLSSHPIPPPNMYKVTGFLSALLLPLLSVGAIAAPSTTAVRQLACNGNAALCDRLYSNVSQVGAHDSPFVGSWVTDNQDLSVTAQLNAGIRFLQGQTHKNTFGKLHMCHTSCWELDVGHLTVYLTTIREWLDNNPNEVVTLLLTNGASVAATKFAGSFVDSGLTKYVYTPPTSAKVEMGSWPTLREMIASGTRLVAFLGKSCFSYPRSKPALTDFPRFWSRLLNCAIHPR